MTNTCRPFQVFGTTIGVTYARQMREGHIYLVAARAAKLEQ